MCSFVTFSVNFLRKTKMAAFLNLFNFKGSLALACIPLSLVTVFGPIFVRNYYYVKVRGSYNNVTPREMIKDERLKGPGGEMAKRANAAHYNGLETFPMFAAGVLSAKYAGVEAQYVDKLAMAFVVSRVFYNFFYIFGDTTPKSILRAIAYLFGIGCIFSLMVSAASNTL
jgi:uncharacterized MAPEG superfamily protein